MVGQPVSFGYHRNIPGEILFSTEFQDCLGWYGPIGVIVDGEDDRSQARYVIIFPYQEGKELIDYVGLIRTWRNKGEPEILL